MNNIDKLVAVKVKYSFTQFSDILVFCLQLSVGSVLESLVNVPSISLLYKLKIDRDALHLLRRTLEYSSSISWANIKKLFKTYQ